MTTILNWIVKGLMQWLYGLYWQAGEYIMNTLMDVFSMDMNYFKTAVPVSEVILNIMFGVGWALLLGNLVFQAAKSMMSGIGFEGEDPRTLGARTLVFAFLLVCSRQICEIGLSLGAAVVDLLQVPSSVILPSLTEDMFGIDASWILMSIVGIIIIFQLVKFFFEVGERYVIVGVLTILSPLAFAMGGSRNTMDVFKGWARMYGSMCLMLVMNVVFMKLIISAMAIFPHGLEVFPWIILVIALARVARKIDNIIARIGLNPAITGDGLGRGLPGMMAMMVGRSLISGAMGGKFAAGKAAAGAAKSAASGAAAHAVGFSGGARPAPSPINTAADNAVGGSPTPVNPPVGRTTGTVQQGKTGRPSGTQSSVPHGVHGKPARGGIAVSADDIPTRQNADDGSVPQTTRMNTATSSHPLDTNKGTGLAGAQGAGGQEKPSHPPRSSGDMKPVDVSATTTPIASAQQAHSQNTSQTSGVERQHRGVGGQSGSIQNGGVSPVHTSKSTQQGARVQVNAATSQGGTQVQSNAHISQKGAQLQQSVGQTQQNVQQNTQSPTRAGSSPQPVPTQAVSGTSAEKIPSASHQQTVSAPAPTGAAQAGKSTAKTQTTKPSPKTTPVPVPSTDIATGGSPATNPLDLHAQGKQSKQEQPKAEKKPNTPKTTGKNQAPAPIIIGQRDAGPNVAAGGTGDDLTVTGNE